MTTSNKTVLLNLSAKQYSHLVELAALIETITEVPTDVETIASKLFTRTLSCLKIGTHTAPNEQDQPDIEKEEAKEPEEAADQDQQTEKMDVNEKTFPQAIAGIVSSLQNAVEKKAAQPVPNIGIESRAIEGFKGGWRRILGNIEFGARIAIMTEDKETATRAALSICQDLNTAFNTMYFAPKHIGDCNEMPKVYAIEKSYRPYQTKVIHYLPTTLQEWKRLLFDHNQILQYGPVVFDNASELGFGPAFPCQFPKLVPFDMQRVVQIYTLAHTPENLQAWKDQLDIVFHILPDFEITMYKNKFRELPNK